VYIGHLGLALACKGRRPRLSLPWLVLSTQGCDWLDAALLPFMPWARAEIWTHSLVAALIGATVMMLFAHLRHRDRVLSWSVALLYLSHPLLDYPTGLKPTWPGGPWIGLQLYTRPLADFLLETSVIALGWVIYRRSLPEEQQNSALAWALLGGLLALQLGCDLHLASLHGPLWTFS
jgi:hypothetical protein